MPRIEYLVSILLAVAYAGYVLGVMALGMQVASPLGDLGECLLVFVSVIAFVTGLLRDEALRKSSPQAEPSSLQEETRP